MGQLTIDDDDENLNLLYLSNFSSFGTPIIIPRLGNKTLDPNATGGGRSFTPRMLRRLVYECLGMGAWHIGPIHWRAKLTDGEWFIKGTDAEAEAKKVFKQIKDAHFLLTGMSRLQPKVGLYVSDAMWLQRWNPVWTDLFQQALADQWQITIASDGIISGELAYRMPILISVDNSNVARTAQEKFSQYIASGGRVFTVGEFANYDELGNSSGKLGAEICQKAIAMDIQPESESKKLVNSFSTNLGAWQPESTCKPLPLCGIKKKIVEYFPEFYLKPISIKSDNSNHDINIFTLTDGVSLLAVIINRSPVETSFDLQLQLKESINTDRLSCYDVTDDRKIVSNDGRTDRIAMEPYGVKMVWLYPAVSEDSVERETEKAAKTISSWKTKEADISWLEKIERALFQHQAKNNIENSKKYCLAKVITSSLCLKPEIIKKVDSTLAFKAKVYDSDGQECIGADVKVRIVPGIFERVKLTEKLEGEYANDIDIKKLSYFYNPVSQKYEVASPFRVLFNARKDDTFGGSWIVFELDDVGYSSTAYSIAVSDKPWQKEVPLFRKDRQWIWTPAR